MLKTKKIKEVINQIKQQQQNIKALESIWELEYVIKSKVERKLYEYPDHDFSIIIVDLDDNEILINGKIKGLKNE